MQRNDTVRAFMILNFVWAGFSAFGLILMLLAMVYGVAFSGDSGKDLAAGIFGCILFAIPCSAALGVYLAAGFGLLNAKIYGYYCHIAGAFLAIFTCIGIIYTVFALIYAFRDDFKQAFMQQPPATGM
ncbi:hypothetical protein ACFLU6_15990 [Acidobacteriota bacterium]